MTNMTNNTHKEFRVRKIPEELYKQFKISAVLNGLSVNEFFLEAMTQAVAKKRGKS
jgi:predicted HicB family RNase H-like nuclease